MKLSDILALLLLTTPKVPGPAPGAYIILKIGCLFGGLMIAMMLRRKIKECPRVAFVIAICGLLILVVAWIIYNHILTNHSGSMWVRIASVTLFSYINIVLGICVWLTILLLPKRLWGLVKTLGGK